jgi:hypothetical protein
VAPSTFKYSLVVIGGDASAYVGSESVARDLADPNVGNYENGYIRFDMDPKFESEFGKYRFDYPVTAGKYPYPNGYISYMTPRDRR